MTPLPEKLHRHFCANCFCLFSACSKWKGEDSFYKQFRRNCMCTLCFYLDVTLSTPWHHVNKHGGHHLKIVAGRQSTQLEIRSPHSDETAVQQFLQHHLPCNWHVVAQDTASKAFRSMYFSEWQSSTWDWYFMRLTLATSIITLHIHKQFKT